MTFDDAKLVYTVSVRDTVGKGVLCCGTTANVRTCYAESCIAGVGYFICHARKSSGGRIAVALKHRNGTSTRRVSWWPTSTYCM
jgi:hypothetical protein